MGVCCTNKHTRICVFNIYLSCISVIAINKQQEQRQKLRVTAEIMTKSSSLHLQVIFFLVYSIQCSQCGMSNSPGETQPRSVEININSSANITCRMNLTKFGPHVNSSSLYFVQEDTGKRVSETDIEILNETTVVFMLRNSTEQDRNYVCKSGLMGIGVTHVSVGTAPLDITDFICHGYDYSYMVCSFTIPHNILVPLYNLSYTAQSANYIQTCPLEIQQNRAISNLSLDQNNYRATYEFFNFTLIGKNDVGTNVQSFWINNYESVIPPKPVYTFENITNNSVVIKWYNIKYSFYTAKGLQYEMRLRPKNPGVDWINHSNYEIRNNRSEYKLIVRNIPFAYFLYELSVRVRVKAARNDETYWSEPYIQEFRTSACPPEMAPLTDVGSFYIDPTETKLRLYWRQLPEYKENGPHFQYVIKQVKVNDVEISMDPLQIDRTSAEFRWHRGHRYEFVIKSRNTEGESPDNSTIVVPSWSKPDDLSMSPRWIGNVYHGANRTYTLSWTSPINQDDLMDYTVFWCQSKKVTRNECEDSIYFTHINKNSTSFNTAPQDQNLNMAVSANYRFLTSGMHWTICTADDNSDLAKMEPEIIAITARSITVQWSSDPVCFSLLRGYKLSYCRLYNQKSTNANNTCSEEPITLIIPSTEKKYIIKELQPFSTYKIEMLMFSEFKQGKISDPRIEKTTEEAPSKPLHLKAYNITSNSAVLTWLSPEYRNGILRKYRIEYNNEHHIIDCSADMFRCSPQQMSFTLENLSSYTRYKVYVVAYTNATAASEPSNDIKVKTLVGIPSNPRYIKKKEKSQHILQWSEPEVPSGRVEFYQVAIMVWYKDLIQRQHVSNVVGSKECIFRLPVCLDADYRFTLQVRAVNIAKRESEIDYYIFAAKNQTNEDIDLTPENSYYNSANDDLKCVGTGLNADKQFALMRRYSDSQKYVQYKSVWEKGPETNCADTKLSRMTLFALLAVVSSIGVMAAFYVAHNKYKKMANISCALPPGLEAMTYLTKENSDNDFRRSKEYFYNNESRHLLSSVSHDSGCIYHNRYPSNADAGGTDGITSLGNSSGYIGSDNSTKYCNNADTIGDPDCGVDQTSLVNDAYMVMELLQPNEISNWKKLPSNLLSQSKNNGYTQPSLSTIEALAGGNKNTQLPSTFFPTGNDYIKQMSGSNNTLMIPENSYIKPHSILNWPIQKMPQKTTTSPLSNISVPIKAMVGDMKINSSDYISPQILQKPFLQPNVSNGYTSLEALGKPMDPTQINVSERFNATSDGDGGGGAATIIPPISGYVTQKELSAFGQQHQFN